jgi:zinc protease
MFPTRTALLATTLLLPAALLAQELPKGEAVMERFVEVTGGRAAYAAKHTMVMKGTMEMAAMGLKGAMTLYKAEPNLSLSVIEFPSIGKMQEGFDGKVAWAFSAMQGPQVKTGEERDTTEQSARFHSENWREEYRQVQTLGTETIDGEPCTKVLATPHKGQPATQFYSVKSGLLVRALVKMKSAMGEIVVETTTKDYKNVDGVLVPHTLVQSFAGQTMTISFQSVAWNTPIPRTQFDPPAEIRALLSAPPPVEPKK